MKMNTAAIFLLFLFAVTMGIVDSLKCYKCGVFVQTSVTPCQNLTSNHLETCPLKFCSKYVGLSAVVYGCEADCHERSFGSFDSYCCSEDRCNGASTLASMFNFLKMSSYQSPVFSAALASFSLSFIISRAHALLFHFETV